jgi:amidohydrolase
MDLLDRAHRIASDLVELRRDIHRHPELSFQEVRTAGIAAEETASAGYEVREGVARTGVIAEIGDGDGPTVALRADMDALPIQEKTGLPFASEVDGVMHACGHDAHTAGLIGAARILSSLHDEGKLPAGRIRLLFQPSEETSDDEGKSGAERMVEEGAMDDVDAVIGLHVGAHLPAGRVFLREGPFWGGSDELVVEVRGKGSHAARPEEGVDALALAALGVVAAQQVVSRMTGPSEAAVLSFGTIHGGTAPNVICDRVTLGGSLRYFDHGVRQRIHEGLRRSFSIADVMGGESEIGFRGGYPPVVNDPDVTRWIEESVHRILGEGHYVDAEPGLLAEDFAYLAQAAPGAFFWLGAALPDAREHHSSMFDIDETVLPLASALLAGSAVHILDRLSERDRETSS